MKYGVMERVQRFLTYLAEHISSLCAVFMLCVIPLLFRDAFFDINRVKVSAVICVIPVLGLIWCACVLLGREKHSGKSPAGLMLPTACMLALLLSCMISCATTGFAPHTLTGENGRYCGLYFMAACGAAFLMIATGRRMKDAVPSAVIVCAVIIALLGVLNAVGVDPLGFYAQIKKGQEKIFLSTIGHFDFFGTFLIMMFALAGGYAVFADHRILASVACLASFAMALGMSVSGTDSAFIGMHLVCLALTAISGGRMRSLRRSFVIWAGAMLSLPVIAAILPLSPYGVEISGFPRLLCESGLAVFAGILMLAVSAVLAYMERKGAPAPGRRTVMIAGFGLMLAGIAAVLLIICYFTIVAADAELGEAAFFLRFNDHWGSKRGFVYTRALRAYADFTPIQKLFGKGMETTLATLTPYFDNPEMLVFGVFNDTHCQPLQLLLTCGAFGMTAFIALYGSLFLTIGRYMKEDPLLCGVFCALIGYLVIMAINVTQPILISTYFSLTASAICRIRANEAGAWADSRTDD